MVGAKRRLVLLLVVIPLVLALLFAVGMIAPVSTSHPNTKAEQEQPPASLSQETTSALAQRGIATEIAAIDQCWDAWFLAYVSSRVVNSVPGVTFSPAASNEPVQFDPSKNTTYGPWAAVADYGAADAREDGSVTEWADHYYITHQWSEYGQQILAMRPGDKVSVNGRECVVQAVFDYPKDSFYEEIVRIAGPSALVLQTCIPNASYNRIVFGS